ncbi:MAG TPA: hypothetical protein VNR90_16515 [Vicinamibacterales bacterium]|nr:hypothetical protein [Vicinamibacterales bacterium]
MWGRSARRLGLTLAAIAFAVGCNKTAEKPSEPPPPPEPEVAKATDAQVNSLSEMAVEYEKLEQQQAATNQRMGQLITKYQQRGGSLPPGFGAELTDEQRTLLAERIKTEKAGLRTLLQDLIDRDKEMQQMKTRLDQLETQLPASVVAKEGDRHDRIAMNFLVKQGVPAKKAYEIVSQINLQDALVPGFRVWTYYQKGQFGTWVTRGKANITPQEHAKKVLALLEDERDKALKDLADTSSERDALKTSGAEKEAALSRSAEELKAMTETAEQQRAEVQRREVEANTLRFIVGSKKALVKSKLLEKNMRKWNPATDHMSSLNLLESQEIPIDAASLGLKKVKKVTLVPEIFFAGVDYAIEVGGPTATLKITAPDKFKANRFVIVVE